MSWTRSTWSNARRLIRRRGSGAAGQLVKSGQDAVPGLYCYATEQTDTMLNIVSRGRQMRFAADGGPLTEALPGTWRFQRLDSAGSPTGPQVAIENTTLTGSGTLLFDLELGAAA